MDENKDNQAQELGALLGLGKKKAQSEEDHPFRGCCGSVCSIGGNVRGPAGRQKP